MLGCFGSITSNIATLGSRSCDRDELSRINSDLVDGREEVLDQRKTLSNLGNLKGFIRIGLIGLVIE